MSTSDSWDADVKLVVIKGSVLPNAQSDASMQVYPKFLGRIINRVIADIKTLLAKAVGSLETFQMQSCSLSAGLVLYRRYESSRYVQSDDSNTKQ